METAAQPDATLQASVQAAAEELDEEYFALKEPLEEREDAGRTDPKVSIAFSRARAASAAAGALGRDASEAAASAAYEAASAIDDPGCLMDAAKKALAK